MSISEINRNNASVDLDTVRKETRGLIEKAVDRDESFLVESPPSSGKTTSVFQIIKQSEDSFTYLTKREDLYDQAERLCQANNLNYQLIPSPHRDCSSFDEDDPDHSPKAVDLYELGVSAPRVHAELNLPCSPDCEFMEKWNRVKDEPASVLIGHYKHAYINEVVDGRRVVIDEFPGYAFEREFQDADQTITKFLESADGLPFDDFLELIQNRDDLDLDQEAYEWFIQHGVGRQPERVIQANRGEKHHSVAPFLVFAILCTTDYDNGFSVPWFNILTLPSKFDDPPPADGLRQQRYAVLNRRRSSMHILTPPDLSNAKNVIGLDGTPTPSLWELATNEDLVHETVLSTPDENNAYVKDALGIEIKQAGRGLKPYHSGNITPNRDEAILYGVEVAEGEEPCLISTKRALGEYEQEGILDRAKEAMNYADVFSSNEFAGESVGVIQGAPHPGDDTIERWCAYSGAHVEGEGRGMEKTYGDFGDDIYRHFVHDKVLQAILRFGRGESGATVYLNTRAVPDWLEIDARVNVELFKNKNSRKIADYLRDCGDEGTTNQEIADSLDISERTARRLLKDFIECELVEKEVEPGPYPTVYRWRKPGQPS